MAAEFTMPKLGLTMTDGTIREWLVDDGTFVHAGEPILVIETDKVETEVEARADGVLRLTGVVGSTYACGAVIGYLLDDAAADDIPEPAEAATVATPGLMAVPDVDEPALDLFGDAGPVEAEPESGSGFVAVGDSRLDAAIAAADGLPVPEPALSEPEPSEPEPSEPEPSEPEPASFELDDDLHLSDEAIAAELDLDPVVVEPDPVDPVQPVELVAPVESAELVELVAPVETVEVAEPVEPSESVERPVPAAAAVPLAVADIAARGAGGRILASPRARATALEAELSLAGIGGTGPGGRIVHDDVVAAIAARAEAERAEAERAEAERAEADRRHAERLEAARQAEAERVEAARVEAERVEAERVEAERLEVERLEAARLEAERVVAEREEAERLAVEREAAERQEAEREAAKRVEAERLEAERLEAERAEADRLVAIAAEADRLAALPPPPTDTPDAAVVEPAKERPLTRAASQAQASLPALDPTPTGQPVAATGGARLLADFLGVDLADVGATSGGRVTREDVGAWVRERLAPARPGAAATPSTTAKDAPAEPASPIEFAPLLQEPMEVIPFRGMRGLIAQRMQSSLNDMAQLTLSVDVDMAGVNAERERRRTQGQAVPGYTAWVVSAAAQAIEEHGYVNSQITAEGIAMLPDVHVGVAVALDEGLIVPVIEHANLRTVEETHAVVADLAGRARLGKLQFSELEGATFSVTALGMFGVDMFTPVINPPNTAILGVGRLRSETGWTDGQPSEKTVMTLSLTWDHRAFDGAPAAEFAQTIVRLLQQPAELV